MTCSARPEKHYGDRGRQRQGEQSDGCRDEHVPSGDGPSWGCSGRGMTGWPTRAGCSWVTSRAHARAEVGIQPGRASSAVAWCTPRRSLPAVDPWPVPPRCDKGG